MALTVVISIAGGLAFRERFRGSGILFYTVIISLVAPGYVLGIGIGLMFRLLGLETDWYTSALGAQLTWTLPFGLLIMFAIFGRFNRAYEEAARDLGASPAQTLRLVVIPIIVTGIIAVALFGFTLSYDEFARTLLTSGANNTLPVEIWSMTMNVTSPVIYALGTATTIFSFAVIAIALSSIALIQRRRFGRGDSRRQRSLTGATRESMMQGGYGRTRNAAARAGSSSPASTSDTPTARSRSTA